MKDPEEIKKLIEPIIEYISQMLLAGTLKKNAVHHLTNRGLTKEAADNIVEMAQIRAEGFSFYKIK